MSCTGDCAAGEGLQVAMPTGCLACFGVLALLVLVLMAGMVWQQLLACMLESQIQLSGLTT